VIENSTSENVVTHFCVLDESMTPFTIETLQSFQMLDSNCWDSPDFSRMSSGLVKVNYPCSVLHVLFSSLKQTLSEIVHVCTLVMVIF
jgi:hypothetical protein